MNYEYFLPVFCLLIPVLPNLLFSGGFMDIRKQSAFDRRCLAYFLCCGAGLVLGFFTGHAFYLSCDFWMRLRLDTPVSIVLLYGWILLTFMIAAHAVTIQKWYIVYGLMFLRFLCFGLDAGALLRAFRSGAWLMQPIYQLADWISLILLCCFGASSLQNGRRRNLFGLHFCIFISTLAVIVDFYAVMPILVSLRDSLSGR